jgi:N-acetylglucosamine-6-phosphate deacetylase
MSINLSVRKSKLFRTGDFSGILLESILPTVSLNQTKLLGIDHGVGSLDFDKKANIVLIDSQFNVIAAFIN